MKSPTQAPIPASPEDDTQRQGIDFVRAMVAEDMRTGKFHGRVITRFPPEPNGFLHIGHAKSICLNFGIAEENAGYCNLRFDDTNPETEDAAYVESIMEMVQWLGFDFTGHLHFASDYFPQMYAYAEHLIQEGKAYVDSSSDEEIREMRGTVMVPGTPSVYRDRSVAENLDLFRRMRAGEFPDGAHVLRAKIDLSSTNMLMRDPLLYRIRHAHHYRTQDEWCIYPLYDYAQPIEDAIECVTHSLCTLEFENNREVYDWTFENTPVSCRSYQTEFARLVLDYTVMSKRKLLELVRDGFVDGWDDPRMSTLAGMRRRGVTPEAIRTFCDLVGVTKSNSRVDIGKLEYCIRDDLNKKVPRVLGVLKPLQVVITNYPEGDVEELDAPYYPHDVPLEGSRKLPFSRTIYIDHDDFMEQPPKGYFRLSPGSEVRLRYAYIIRCDEVIKDAAGDIVELRCTYDPATRGGAAPEGRNVKGTIHWVSAAHSLACEVRLYERLFTVPDPEGAAGEDGDWKAFLNAHSLIVLPDARIEPSVRDDPEGTRYQFERQGYFCSDIVLSKPGALVFNRTVTLRDTWAKQATGPAKRDAVAKQRAESRPARRVSAEERPRVPVARTAQQDARALELTSWYKLSDKDAEVLTRDAASVRLLDEAVEAGADARTIANWIINEVSPELREGGELEFGGAQLAALAKLVADGTISSGGAKTVIEQLSESGGDPAEIVERLGLRQINDADEIARVISEVIAANRAKVTDYKSGRTGLLGFFIGQVKTLTGGRANPELVKTLLEKALQ
jgi:glutaminyl-tRNA synthetase